MAIFKKQKKLINQPQERDTSALESVLGDNGTRRVKLYYTACCGCGCHDEVLYRTVPTNSPLKDGDYVTDIEDNDEWE